MILSCLQSSIRLICIAYNETVESVQNILFPILGSDFIVGTCNIYNVLFREIGSFGNIYGTVTE